MNAKEFEQVDQAIQKYGDDWWNDTENDEAPNREWIIKEINNILANDGLTLKVVEIEKETNNSKES